VAFLNAAFYQFTPLNDPGDWAARLEKELSPLGLRGTLIFAHEGLNGFLAGPENEVRQSLALLRTHQPFSSLKAKESRSQEIPFRKLCFKVKPEIVTFRAEAPAGNAPHIDPQKLRQWLEKGEDLLLLDTRNAYETKLGSFRGAHTLPLRHFVDFPTAVDDFPPSWKEKKIVTFCTGGIRCEKAAPHLRARGYDAYQLEGGILNYFEQEGGFGWEGECFVFDERVALNPSLEPSGATLCPRCQGPVPRAALSCLHCGG
jgi:UPF0176 protein